MPWDFFSETPIPFPTAEIWYVSFRGVALDRPPNLCFSYASFALQKGSLCSALISRDLLRIRIGRPISFSRPSCPFTFFWGRVPLLK